MSCIDRWAQSCDNIDYCTSTKQNGNLECNITGWRSYIDESINPWVNQCNTYAQDFELARRRGRDYIGICP